jgi:hypothetical protein
MVGEGDEMKLRAILILAIFGVLLAGGGRAADKERTLHGWFVDEACTRGRVAVGTIEPDNPDCAKRCVKEGSKLMFLSETDKALFEVKDPSIQVENIGFYLEITGSTSDKVLTVNSVKKLAALNSMCENPHAKKRAAKESAK